MNRFGHTDNVVSNRWLLDRDAHVMVAALAGEAGVSIAVAGQTSRWPGGSKGDAAVLCILHLSAMGPPLVAGRCFLHLSESWVGARSGC